MRSLSISLSTQAYGQLRDMILEGQLAPGDALSERHLSERLGLGRMPVREALRELAKDGLVEAQPGRGTSVRRLSFEDLQDIYEARQAVEGMGAFLAAKRGPTPELSAFRSEFQSLLHAPHLNLKQAQRRGQAFHAAIIGAARNAELVRILDSLQAKIALVINMRKNPSRIPISLSEHMAILDAIEAGDAHEAQRRMWEHLARSFEVRIRMFEEVA